MNRKNGAKAPSSVLLAAAMMGLLGGACDRSPPQSEPDPPSCPSAGTGGAAGQPSTGGSTSSSSTGTGAVAGSGGEPTKVISEVEGNKTFAEVKTECDKRGGYTQVSAACAGVNSCAGFSYGDWDPGVTMEHSCAGVNGCNGISCVVLPKDSGKSGKEIYEEVLPESGPRQCNNCHAVWNDDGPDVTKFKLYLLPGSPRNASNWLDFPAASQARIVAFGKKGQLDDGTSYSNMSAYHTLYSRAEIERVVEYIRTKLEIVPTTIKVAD